MLLYHATTNLHELVSDKVLQTNHKLDFGPAFYTTQSQQQAKDWALKKAAAEMGSKPVIYVFEYTPNPNLQELDLGSEYNEAWLKVIYQCKFLGKRPKADIVSGRCILQKLTALINKIIPINQKELFPEEIQVILQYAQNQTPDRIFQKAFCTDAAMTTLKLVKTINKIYVHNFSELFVDEISDEEFLEILPDIVDNLVVHLSAKYHYPYDTALSLLYQTQTYQALQNKQTALWEKGPVALKNTLELEIRTGCFEYPN